MAQGCSFAAAAAGAPSTAAAAAAGRAESVSHSPVPAPVRSAAAAGMCYITSDSNSAAVACQQVCTAAAEQTLHRGWAGVWRCIAPAAGASWLHYPFSIAHVVPVCCCPVLPCVVTRHVQAGARWPGQEGRAEPQAAQGEEEPPQEGARHQEGQELSSPPPLEEEQALSAAAAAVVGSAAAVAGARELNQQRQHWRRCGRHFPGWCCGGWVLWPPRHLQTRMPLQQLLLLPDMLVPCALHVW